jgi:hypothetical protein
MATKTESLDKVSAPKRKKSVIKTDKIEVGNKQTDNDQFKVEELSKMVELLSQQLQEMKNNENKQVIYVQQPNEQSGVIKDIAPNELTKIQCLLDNPLNLSTQPHGRGKYFGFDHFGETKNIMYSDLLEIINNQKNFMEAGYFYILDRKIIDFNSLEEVYDKILNKEQIERILANKEDAISLFQKANKKQQKVIANMVIKRLTNNESIDYNLVDALSKASEVNIQEKVNITLEVRKSMNEEIKK